MQARGEPGSSLFRSPFRKVQKGKNPIQSSSKIASPSVPAPYAGSSQPRTVDELTYQAVTIVAALLLLGSLWAF